MQTHLIAIALAITLLTLVVVATTLLSLVRSIVTVRPDTPTNTLEELRRRTKPSTVGSGNRVALRATTWLWVRVWSGRTRASWRPEGPATVSS